MYKLLTLESSRQQKLIDAGFRLFTKHGYDETSTNELAQVAGVTKPTLFHYIESKKKFYLYLFHVSTDAIMKRYSEFAQKSTSDFLEHMRESYFWKLTLMKELRQEYSFVQSVMRKPTKTDLFNEIKTSQLTVLNDTADSVYKSFDRNLFRIGIDVDKAIRLIMWSLFGYGESLLNSGVFEGDKIDFDAIGTQYNEYIDVLKQAYYNNEIQ